MTQKVDQDSQQIFIKALAVAFEACRSLVEARHALFHHRDRGSVFGSPDQEPPRDPVPLMRVREGVEVMQPVQGFFHPPNAERFDEARLGLRERRVNLRRERPEDVYSQSVQVPAISSRTQIRAVTCFLIQIDVVPANAAKRLEANDLTLFLHIVSCPVVYLSTHATVNSGPW